MYRWFKKNKGKDKRPCQKPLLTEAHKNAWVAHAVPVQTLIAEGKTIWYLDERWLYYDSERCSVKYLPRADSEVEGADRIKVR